MDPTKISFRIAWCNWPMSDFTTWSDKSFCLRLAWEIIACEAVSFTLVVCHQYVLQGKLFHSTSSKSSDTKNQGPNQKTASTSGRNNTKLPKKCCKPSVKHLSWTILDPKLRPGTQQRWHLSLPTLQLRPKCLQSCVCHFLLDTSGILSPTEMARKHPPNKIKQGLKGRICLMVKKPLVS